MVVIVSFNKQEWNKIVLLVLNNQEIFIDLANFTFQDQPNPWNCIIHLRG